MRQLIGSIALLMILIFGGGIRAQESQSFIGPETYPAGINPLTGLVVDDPAVLDRRPLMVKVINAPAEVRPQAGLMAADVVWEHLLAGGITRFSAIYLGQEPGHVGPIRSARLVDFELVRIYRSLFTYSGMSEGVIAILRGDGLMSSRLVGGAGPCPALCRFPDEGAKLEWTLFGDATALREQAVVMNRDTTVEAVYGMAFSEQRPAGGVPVEGINVAYRQTDVQWTYHPVFERWLREQDGEPHFDKATGTQINTANVLIIEEDHIVQPFVHEGYWGPPNYAFSVNLIGSGRIYLFRDGRYYVGEWRREDREDPLRFYDMDGNPLPFKPGTTFINLVPRWVDGYQLAFSLTNAPLATVVGAGSGVNLRVGPGTQYRAVGSAFSGDLLTAIGRNPSLDWVQVVKGEDILWLSASVLSLTPGEIELLPLPRPTVER
jgi:hypothetical protein